jgi:hypothetical protein
MTGDTKSGKKRKLSIKQSKSSKKTGDDDVAIKLESTAATASTSEQESDDDNESGDESKTETVKRKKVRHKSDLPVASATQDEALTEKRVVFVR